MAAWFSAIGVEVWNTTCAVSPALEGNLACRMSAACWDGVLPAENLFSKFVPITWASTVMPMTTRIQATSTSHRRS